MTNTSKILHHSVVILLLSFICIPLEASMDEMDAPAFHAAMEQMLHDMPDKEKGGDVPITFDEVGRGTQNGVPWYAFTTSKADGTPVLTLAVLGAHGAIKGADGITEEFPFGTTTCYKRSRVKPERASLKVSKLLDQIFWR